MSSARQLRDLFAPMLMFCELTDPMSLFERHLEHLGEDITYQTIDTAILRSQVLCEMERILIKNGSSLARFPSMPSDFELPLSSSYGESQSNDVLSGIINSSQLSSMLNDGQRVAYDTICTAVDMLNDPEYMYSAKCFLLMGQVELERHFYTILLLLIYGVQEDMQL